jgi:UDP-glucuronate 4-epimerase
MKILVAGGHGFIGYNLLKLILEKKFKIIGLDNINDYYSSQLKKDCLKQLKKVNNF